MILNTFGISRLIGSEIPVGRVERFIWRSGNVVLKNKEVIREPPKILLSNTFGDIESIFRVIYTPY